MLLQIDGQRSRRARRIARERTRHAAWSVAFTASLAGAHLSGVDRGDTSFPAAQRTRPLEVAEVLREPTPARVVDAPQGVVPLTAPVDEPLPQQTVTITVVGDIHMEGPTRTLLDPNAHEARKSVTDLVATSDLTIGNLETALGSGGDAATKEYTFQAPLETLDVLGEMGFDVVTMANNHGLDFGRDLVAQAIASNGRAGVAIVGIGRNANEAYAPHIADIRGVRVAVIGASDVFDDESGWAATDTRSGLASAQNAQRLEAAVSQAQEVSDFTIVYLHWGVERETCPSSRQQQLVERLSALGVDAVVGAHSHRVQGAGFSGSTFVAYGLGNFIWYQNQGESGRSEVVSFQLSGGVVSGFTVTPVSVSGGIPGAAPAPIDAAQRQVLDERASCANLSGTPSESPAP